MPEPEQLEAVARWLLQVAEEERIRRRPWIFLYAVGPDGTVFGKGPAADEERARQAALRRGASDSPEAKKPASSRADVGPPVASEKPEHGTPDGTPPGQR